MFAIPGPIPTLSSRPNGLGEGGSDLREGSFKERGKVGAAYDAVKGILADDEESLFDSRQGIGTTCGAEREIRMIEDTE
jgi:hypothetical protein